MMPISIDARRLPGILRLGLTGAWRSVEESRVLDGDLLESTSAGTETSALIDLRMLASLPPYTEVRTVMPLGCANWLVRRAYLVASAVQFGMVRQMQALAPPGISIEIFFDETDALRWLRMT
jgi:hypothetical protein